MIISAWTTEFVLYGSKYRSKDAQIYYVGNRGKPHWTSKVSRTYPIRGYPKGIFYFYGPSMFGISFVSLGILKRTSNKYGLMFTFRTYYTSDHTKTNNPPSNYQTIHKTNNSPPNYQTIHKTNSTPFPNDNTTNRNRTATYK